MAFALPRQIQLKLEQALAQWPHWHCEPALERAPTVVSVLTPGHGNFSVLVDAGRRFVVRIDGLNPAHHGLNRQAEWRTLQAASAAGLAPRPRYFNPDLGCLVCDHLEADPAATATAAETGQLLRAIHALPARHHRLDLAERVLRYEKLLEQRDQAAATTLRRFHEPVRALLPDCVPASEDIVLCHNDLLQANRILHRGRLWALDWEYSAMASRWHDIAVVIHGDGLSDAEADALLDAYLGRAASVAERAMLQRHGCLYRYLELLWYLTLERPVLDANSIAAKTSALAACLARNRD